MFANYLFESSLSGQLWKAVGTVQNIARDSFVLWNVLNKKQV